MSINEFRAYALRTMCEAHLWKTYEQDFFNLRGYNYKIKKEAPGAFSLTQRYPGAPDGCKEGEPMIFPDMGRLFHHLFDSRMISYEG